MNNEVECTRPVPNVVLDIDNVDGDNIVLPTSDSPTWSGKLKFPPDSQSFNSQRGNSTLINNKNVAQEDQKYSKNESRATPRRTQYAASRHKYENQSSSRPCEQHTFLTDITEVRQMEQGLLKLLDDFHSGKLQAFGKDCTFEKMEEVREQQERLARLHFELNAQQEMYGPQSENCRLTGRENLGKLIENLQQLNRSIEQLQISSPSLQTDV